MELAFALFTVVQASVQYRISGRLVQGRVGKPERNQMLSGTLAHTRREAFRFRDHAKSDFIVYPT